MSRSRSLSRSVRNVVADLRNEDISKGASERESMHIRHDAQANEIKNSKCNFLIDFTFAGARRGLMQCEHGGQAPTAAASPNDNSKIKMQCAANDIMHKKDCGTKHNKLHRMVKLSFM
jgi:hypothetical protein